MKTIFLLVAFWLSSGVVQAATLPELGVLLTTPEEREKIDLLRRAPDRERSEEAQGLLGISPEAELSAATPEPPAPPELITLHGLIKRGDGSSVAWINRQHTLYSTTIPPGIEFLGPLNEAATARLRLNATAEELLLRVGQTRLVPEGVTLDLYQQPPKTATPAAAQAPGLAPGPDSAPAPASKSKEGEKKEKVAQSPPPSDKGLTPASIGEIVDKAGAVIQQLEEARGKK